MQLLPCFFCYVLLESFLPASSLPGTWEEDTERSIADTFTEILPPCIAPQQSWLRVKESHFLLDPSSFCVWHLPVSQSRKRQQRETKGQECAPITLRTQPREMGSIVFLLPPHPLPSAPAHFHSSYVCEEPQEDNAIWQRPDNHIPGALIQEW